MKKIVLILSLLMLVGAGCGAAAREDADDNYTGLNEEPYLQIEVPIITLQDMISLLGENE